jgi:hypothetical protein
MSFFVNGARQSSVQAFTTPWDATGPLQVGRVQSAGAFSDPFEGDLDDVRVYDRVVSATEPDAVNEVTGGIADLANRPVINEAHWTGDAGSGMVAADSSGQGRDATLSSASAWTPDGQFDNAFNFNDATKDHAQSAGAVVRTDSSFTVTCWVKAARLVTMTAVSQDGSRRSGFYLGDRLFDGVRYWSFTLPPSDGDSGDWISAHGLEPVTALDGEWHHLTGVYDAAVREIRLYVDGVVQSRTPYTTPWNTTGRFQIGQAKNAGAAVDFWSGGVDDVQVFTGVLSDAEISDIGS